MAITSAADAISTKNPWPAVEYRIVEEEEKLEQLRKDISNEIGRLMAKYGKNWRRGPEAEEDRQDVYGWLEETLKINDRLGGMQERYDLDRLELMKKFLRLQIGRGYGGSF